MRYTNRPGVGIRMDLERFYLNISILENIEKSQEMVVICPNCETPLIVSKGQDKKFCHVCQKLIDVREARIVEDQEKLFILKHPTLLDKLDLIDLSILKKFYMAGKEPFDTMPHCLPVLHRELKKNGLKIGRRSFEYRLKKLVSLNLIRRVEKTNPSIYEPIPEIKKFVRKLIVMILTKTGLGNI